MNLFQILFDTRILFHRESCETSSIEHIVRSAHSEEKLRIRHRDPGGVQSCIFVVLCLTFKESTWRGCLSASPFHTEGPWRPRGLRAPHGPGLPSRLAAPSDLPFVPPRTGMQLMAPGDLCGPPERKSTHPWARRPPGGRLWVNEQSPRTPQRKCCKSEQPSCSQRAG